MAEKNDSSWHIGKLEEWKWNVGISTIKIKCGQEEPWSGIISIWADDEYHLTVLGVIRRPDGRFLITKRVMTKAWAPGWWEVSGWCCAGRRRIGRGSAQGSFRRDRTGRKRSGRWLCIYLSQRKPGEGDNYFVDVYRYTMDVTEQDVHLQTEETDGCRFATPEEIRELADQGIFLHYDSIKRVFED